MSSITITVKVVGNQPVRLIAAKNESFTDGVVRAQAQSPHPQFGYARFTIDGLDNATKYYVAVESVTGERSGYVGEFVTQGVGAHSFSFGTASCAINRSNARTFDSVRNASENGDIEFFIHTGDLHYYDIAVNDEALFHDAYDATFTPIRQNKCWRKTPMLYMWDDHDYGPNDSDRDSPSRQASVAAYRNRVPSPQLAKSGIEDAPYYSYVRGRVRFIATDVRSERAEKGEFPSTDPQQIVFTDEQRDWFFDEMLAAKAAGQVICWINSKPWVASVSNGADHWGGYAAARQEIADFINANELEKRLFIVSGDMHALAFDDGSSVNNVGGLYVIQSAAFDSGGSEKGGPYKVPPIRVPATGRVFSWSIVDVIDSGGATIQIDVTGISVNNSTGAENIEYQESFTLEAD